MEGIIPPNLRRTYQNLTGYKKSLVRFYADRTGVINANDVLRWTFPKEIMTMDTLMHYFEFTSTASQSATSTRQGTHFPRNSASIIDTITILLMVKSLKILSLIIIYLILLWIM